MEQLSFWDESAMVLNHLKGDSTGTGNTRSETPLVKEEQQLYRYCDTVTGNLNFTTVATSEDDEYNYNKKKLSRDPMSHRIIEKRRRDRMNNCLADLSRLIPADYMKKGRGRIEKTEIIEMAIKHMKHLQDHHASCHLGNCDMDHHPSVESEESYSPPEPSLVKSLPTHENMRILEINTGSPPRIIEEHYRLGYHECLSETMHFLVEVEGMYAGDKLCVQLISHLQRHCDKILKGGGLNAPRPQIETTSSETTSLSSQASKERSCGSGSSSDGGERPQGGGDDHYFSSASQLRNILTSNGQSRLKMGPQPPSPSNSINGGTSSQTENHSSSGSLYKFKNNIKQRFSAERTENTEHTESNEQLHPLALKRHRSDNHRTSSIPSPSLLKYQQPSSPSPPPGVPIFALHPKASFYIPLTIDHHVLAPFLNDLTNIDTTNLASLVLHPVTISVNFQHSVMRPLNQPLSFSQTSGASWGISQANYLPMPKWATCTPERN